MKGKKIRMIIIIVIASLLSIGGFLLFNNYQIRKADKELAKKEVNQKKIENRTIQEIEILKAHSYLGLDFFSLKADEQQNVSEEGKERDMVPEGVTADNRQLYGYYFTYAGKYRMTKLEIYSADYNVLEIKVTDDVTLVEDIMSKYNYTKVETPSVYEGTKTKVYQKYDIHIVFETKESETEISSIFLSVSSEKEDDGKMH